LISLYKVDPMQDPRWADFVARDPRASIFHTVGWLEALRRTYGYRPVVFTTSSPTSELKNGIVFASVRSWITGERLVSLPFSDHCEPLFDSPEELNFVLHYLQAEMDHQAWKYVEVRPINGILSRKEAASQFQPSASYCFHRLSLEPEIEAIFQSLDKNSVRRRIRHAEREGLVEKCGRSEDLLAKFYDLMVVTRKRHGLPPQPLVWFRNLVDCLGEAVEIRLACTKTEGIAVAAILTLRFRDTVVYKYGCSDWKFNHLGAMPLLLWRAIENGKAVGAKEFDMGRSDESNASLIAFKDKWAKNSSRLVYWRFPPPQAVDSENSWKLRLAKQLFGHMPNRFLAAFGRSFYRHIG